MGPTPCPNPSVYRQPSLSLGYHPFNTTCCVHAEHEGFRIDAYVTTYMVPMKPAAYWPHALKSCFSLLVSPCLPGYPWMLSGDASG